MSECWHNRPWSSHGGVWCIDCLTDRDEKIRKSTRRELARKILDGSRHDDDVYFVGGAFLREIAGEED